MILSGINYTTNANLKCNYRMGIDGKQWLPEKYTLKYPNHSDMICKMISCNEKNVQ